MKNIDIFLEKVKNWAETQKDIKAIVLVGSYARGQEREDSDVDLIIMTVEPDKYLNDPSLCIIWRYKYNGKGKLGRVISYRTWYKDSFEVEFGLQHRTG